MVANADLAARRFPRLEVLNKVIKKLLGTLAEWTRCKQYVYLRSPEQGGA